jgi:hypothetical protein
MFVKHIIKTLQVSVTIVWPSSGGRLSCSVPLLLSLLVCVVKLFIWYVAVCCLQYNICIRMIPWFYLPWYEENEAYDEKGVDLTYVCACLMYLSVGWLVVNCLLLRVGAAWVHITGLVRWPAVPWWVGFVGGTSECTCFPSGSFSYFYCMCISIRVLFAE